MPKPMSDADDAMALTAALRNWAASQAPDLDQLTFALLTVAAEAIVTKCGGSIDRTMSLADGAFKLLAASLNSALMEHRQ